MVPDIGDCVDCPSRFSNAPCHTLQYIASYSNFTSNTIFHFLEGKHTLSTVLEVTNVANLSLVGYSPPSIVKCSGKSHAGFIVTNFTNFRIENISFLDCNIGPQHTTFFLANGSGLFIDGITISKGAGLEAQLLQNNFSIINSAFLDVTSGQNKQSVRISTNCTGPSQISLDNCKFLHGQPGGLELNIDCSYVHVTITNSILSGSANNLRILFDMFAGNFVQMSNITISNVNSNGSLFIGVAAHDQGQYLPHVDPLSCGPNLTHQPNYLMEISNITIARSTGVAALHIHDYQRHETDCNPQYILLRDSIITEYTDGTSLLFINPFMKFKTIQATLKNITIKFSSSTRTSSIDPYRQSTSIFSGVLNVTFVDCTFESNQMTPLMASGSNLIFQGNNTFRNNSSASNGAGIKLLQNSYLYMHNNTNLTFAENHAREKGGAIYVDVGSHLATHPRCIFQYQRDVQFHIHFLNNTAGTAGSSLYLVTQPLCYMPQMRTGLQQFLEMFSNRLQNTESDPSVITSDPIRICPCSRNHLMPDCSSAFEPISVYPGEDFTLHLAVVGVLNGTVPGTVHAKFPPSSSEAILGDLQDTQQNKHAHCDDFVYTVYSSQESVYFHLTATDFSPIQSVSVDLKACPAGFDLKNGSCKCNSVFSREDIRCFINNQSILRPANSWIGFKDSFNMMFSKHCPHGYCLAHDVYLSSDDPDIQCADNRTGVLCGQCLKIYSLTFGGQKCSKCSNLYMLLLFPLAASGLVLVAVLFVLNLTVTEGSINGLIFFANVVSMSHFGQYSGTSSRLYTFIAWLNLDLGIDTCFYDGMDAYAETWLQFAFPLYLWIIIAAIIVLCNTLPNKFTKCGMQNAVKVLATLLLLSYTKLQRTLITIFTFTTLRYPNGAVHYVWLYDANIHYLKGKHIYLFVAGMLVLCLLVLPFTFGLALFQYLQACSGRRVCRWVNKLKPVFDAYAGPYKDEFRMWTGLLLAMRTLLIILFSLNITGSPDFNNVVTLVMSLILLLFTTRGIYRKLSCDVLEAFFYAQIGIFSGVSIYSSHNSGNVSALASVSFAMCILVFLLVIGHHAFSLRKVICSCRKDYEALDPEEEEQLLFCERERLDPSLALVHPSDMLAISSD